jgi:peroxiredoxin
LGFKVIAVSPDRPEKLQESLEVKGLGYALYSDSSLEVARRFGIVFQLDEALVKEYEGYGIDLEVASGKAHHQLPVPSVFLVDPKGEILWVYSNPDYQVRPDNEKLLEAAKRFASRTTP